MIRKNRLHLNTSLRPRPQKAVNTQWYLMQSNHRRMWQLHNPLEPVPADQQIQPIRWLEHLSLKNLMLHQARRA
jgi:hypothetical protein